MQGKEKIFEQLFHSHYEAMYRLAFTYLHDKEESRDIVSEVFARLWDSGLPVRADMQRPILLACIRNRCLNVIARKSRDERLRRLYPLEQSYTQIPEEENEQCLKEILDAIENDLTPQAGRILYLRYGEGKSYRETAEILGISISAVNKHVVKALKKLRTKFLKNNEL